MFLIERHYCENFRPMNKNHSKNVLQLNSCWSRWSNIEGDSRFIKVFLGVHRRLTLAKVGFIFCVPKVKPLLNSRFSRSWVKCEIGKKIGALKNNCGEGGIRIYNIQRLLSNSWDQNTTNLPKFWLHNIMGWEKGVIVP